MKRDEAINRILSAQTKSSQKSPINRENIIIIMDLLFGKEREMTSNDVLRFMNAKGIKISIVSVSKIVKQLIAMGFKLGVLVDLKTKDRSDVDLGGITWGKFKVMPNGEPIPKEFLR